MGLRLGETFNRAGKRAEKKRAAERGHASEPILVIAKPKKAKPSKKKGKK